MSIIQKRRKELPIKKNEFDSMGETICCKSSQSYTK